MMNNNIQIKKRSTTINLMVNAFLASLKIITGILLGSIAMLSEGINNLFDLLSAAIAWGSILLAQKPADQDHPYGHGRYEYIGSFVIGILVLLTSVQLLLQASNKLLAGSYELYSPMLIGILIISICLKVLVYQINAKYHQQLPSAIFKAVMTDSRSDILSSGFLILLFILQPFTSISLDGIGGIIISGFIFISAISLLLENSSLLLGKSIDQKLVTQYANTIFSFQEVLGVHDLFAHEYGQGQISGSVDILVSDQLSLTQAHQLVDKIEHTLRNVHNIELTIHLDPVSSDEKFIQMIIQKIKPLIEKELTAEEFESIKIVQGYSHLTVFIDVPSSKAVLEKEFSNQFKRIEPAIKIRFTPKD